MMLRSGLAFWVGIVVLASACAPQQGGTAGQDVTDTAQAPEASADALPADAPLPPPDVPVAADVSQVQDVTEDSLAVDTAPDVPAPKTVVTVHHPAAAELTLRGNTPPLSWEADLAPTQVTGTQARFELPVATGPIQVKALHKGQWALGANHLVQPAADRHLYPYFQPSGAGGRREDFQIGDQAGKSRTVRVFLPPGYDENTAAKYPLLLVMDGQNLFEDETASFGVSWQLKDAVLGQLGKAKLTEIVVVGVDHAGPKRIDEYTPWPDATEKQGGGGGPFVAWLQAKLLPELETRYRLLQGRQHRVLGGSSLGALISLYAVGSQPQTWGGAILMSGAWWWDGLHALTWYPAVYPQQGPVRLWLDAGDVSDGLKDTEKMRAMLLGLGLQEPATLGYYVAKGAGHNEAAWAARVHLPLAWFFDPGDRVPPF